jgi:hypothetical protein
MSRVKTLALTVVVLFALAGCGPMFEFNLFGGLDNPPTPTVAEYAGSDGLDELDEDLDSPAMVEVLADSGLVDDILSQIANEFLGGDPPVSCADEEAQQAAVVYADLLLKTTEGEELVNNIVEVLLGGMFDGSETIAEILAAIIPPEALASEAVFTATVNALLAANEVYLLLGQSIDQLAPLGEADPGATLPPGVLPGDVAQKALVAYTMWAAVERVMTGLPILTQVQAIAEMFDIAGGAPCALTIGALAQPPDPIEALLDLAGFMP